MKKRFFAIILALTLCAGLVTPAFAEDTESVTVAGITFDAIATDQHESYRDFLEEYVAEGSCFAPLVRTERRAHAEIIPSSMGRILLQTPGKFPIYSTYSASLTNSLSNSRSMIPIVPITHTPSSRLALRNAPSPVSNVMFRFFAIGCRAFTTIF